MQDTIVTIYCLCDDLLKGMQHRDDVQTRFSTAQVMTVPLVAASFFVLRWQPRSGAPFSALSRLLFEHLKCELIQSATPCHFSQPVAHLV